MKKGFTLIEVVVAMMIAIIALASIFSFFVLSYASLNHNIKKNMAVNIASYFIEELRARVVTSENYQDFLDENGVRLFDYDSDSQSANYGKFYEYGHKGDPTYELELPGFIDITNAPLNSNGSSAHSINSNPAPEGATYHDSQFSFYYSLQGYTSFTSNPTVADPSNEDENAFVSAAKQYRDKVTNNWYVIKLPFDAINEPQKSFKQFRGLGQYQPKIYTEDANKTNQQKPEYYPHYTNAPGLKDKCKNYKGFRILTKLVARSLSGSTALDYFDVQVTVFWMESGVEKNYVLSSKIIVY